MPSFFCCCDFVCYILLCICNFLQLAEINNIICLFVVDIDLILQQREKDTFSSAAPYLNNPLINGASMTAVSVHEIPPLHLMKELKVPSVVSAPLK